MESSKSSARKRGDDYDLIKSLKHIPQRIPFLGKPTSSTVSIAIPISILANCQTEELRTYVVGSIARTCTIFGISEVVLFNDFESLSEDELKRYKSKIGLEPSALMNYFAKILEYLDTPQYLRKSIYGYEKELKHVGLLNPLDAPHHLRANEWLPFRQGVIVSDDDQVIVDCGLPAPVVVHGEYKDLAPKKRRKITLSSIKEDPEPLQSCERVTLQLDINSLSIISKLKRSDSAAKPASFTGKIVDRTLPTTLMGLYWGYTVRMCQTFDEIFKHKYDLVIGTSEHGDVIGKDFKLPKFDHLLIVFGGIKGLEVVVNNPKKRFNYYINVCEHQRSRTIRTEEAIPICLAKLYPFNHN